MATLGKVLAVFNVLAAIGFLVVAGMDYNRRQSWAYSHFRHQLTRDLQTLDDEKVGRLVARFEGLAGQAVKPGTDQGARRRAIADFLYDFEYSPTWHQRVQNVVGLEQYVAAAERQTARLRD